MDGQTDKTAIATARSTRQKPGRLIFHDTETGNEVYSHNPEVVKRQETLSERSGFNASRVAYHTMTTESPVGTTREDIQ